MAAFIQSGRSNASFLESLTVCNRPIAVIEKGLCSELSDSMFKKSRLQSEDDLTQYHNYYENDAEHLVEAFSL